MIFHHPSTQQTCAKSNRIMKTPSCKARLTNIFQLKTNHLVMVQDPQNSYTPLKINIAPEKWWLEECIPVYLRWPPNAFTGDVFLGHPPSESPWPMPAPTSKAHGKRPLAFPRTRAKRLRFLASWELILSPTSRHLWIDDFSFLQGLR